MKNQKKSVISVIFTVVLALWMGLQGTVSTAAAESNIVYVKELYIVTESDVAKYRNDKNKYKVFDTPLYENTYEKDVNTKTYLVAELTDKADEAITVTVKAPDTVQKVYLTSETGTGLVSTRTKVDNGDGTATWTLTLSLGTIGERVLSVFADGEDTGADAELEIVYPAASGKVEVISAVSPAEVKANEPFTVTITTNSYAKNVQSEVTLDELFRV